MLRDRVKVKKTISLSLTAKDWDLFDDMYGADLAAKGLNVALENAVNSGMGANDAVKAVSRVMESLAKYGATDSEPHRVLDRLINYIYGDSEL